MPRVLVVLHDHEYHDPELGAKAEPEDGSEPVFEYASHAREPLVSETLEAEAAHELAASIEGQRAQLGHDGEVTVWGETRLTNNMIARVLVLDGENLAERESPLATSNTGT